MKKRKRVDFLHKRYMGLDVGNKTIGVAVSDLLLLTAQGITTVKRKGIKTDLKELEDIMSEYGVEKTIVGLPKNMNNTLGPQGEKVLKFVEKFKEKFPEMEVVMVDERLSTVSAERALIGGDVRREKRKDLIDKVAATYILQSYLDKERGERVE
ncbi:putative holliday junction resolvase [Andreesenia angusta]|uniref:Putative pre-16S rRNA nuclease n=1 Tax=Andreesenia angusta TaxID=39480 RepID=A0A1S1V8T5_9FIRM|nr:Holliday junction resolvase RuvX [Andreesenia angusta]OHW63006.1 putative holliday junction resolvase [Andreesenia angusta]